ncbi:MAG: PAS domain S-box protein [Chloroflexota bacterium]
MESNFPHESDSQPYNEIHRFFEYSLDLFGISGFDGYLKRVNPAWERTLGYTLEELLSTPAIEFIHPEDRANSLNQRQQTHSGSPVINFENRYLCKDGSVKWMEWTAYPYPEDGLNYIVGRDVTERKLAQDALRQSQEAMRGLLTGMPSRALLMLPDGTILMANDLQAAGFGVSLVALIGSNFFDLTPLDTEAQEQRRHSINSVVASKTPLVVEVERAGEYFETSITPIRSESGEVTSIVIAGHDITQLKQTEAKLRQSERMLRDLLNGSQDMAFLTDVDGNLITFNTHFAEQFGKSPEALFNANFYDLLPPEVVESRRQSGLKAIESKQVIREEIEFLGRVMDYTIYPILDEQQQVVNLARFAHDITHLKQIEAGLRQSELTVRDLLNGSPDMAFLTDIEGKLIAFNQKFADQFGPSEVELLGTPIDELLPPDSVRVRKTIAKQVLETRQPIREEIEYYGQFFDYTVYPILNESQEITSLATFSQDITQRKQVEQKLRNSEQQFRGALESAVQGIVIVNALGQITLLNQYAEQEFGYEHEELLGQRIEVLIPDAQRGIHEQHREGYLSNPETRPMGTGMELMGQRKDGSVFPVEVSLSYMGNSGELLVMAFVNDISERKQMEQERIDNQRIQLEVKQEREIIAMRQQFMSMVSHEFRTPLTVIASSTEILQHYDDRLTRERRMEKLQVINGQVRTMVSLLDDILALNKIQAGVADFSPERLDLLALCVTVLNNIKVMDQDRHQFIFDGQPASAPVLADRRSLEHSITNLLSNAVKYSPAESSIRLSVSTTERSVDLEIGDQGIGIPVEDQAHLFEPFYRARNARKIEGTGLGLAIVKHNVEQHGGTITCRSAEGKGTIFSIHLPAAEGA